MKKTLLSLALLTSLSPLSTTYANTSPTVLYFHDKQNNPIQDFPFKAAQETLTALDDGYKVLDSPVDTIEVVGKSYEIHPGELNEIEVVNPEIALSTEENPTTEVPTDETAEEQTSSITIHAVDRAFTSMEDGTIIYLKQNDEVIDETEVHDGIATFNDIDDQATYEVSFSDATDKEKPVTIKSGEEKYLIHAPEVSPIKHERRLHRVKHSAETIQRAPEDTKPLLARREEAKKKEAQKNEVKKNENNKTKTKKHDVKTEKKTTSKSEQTHDVKPQLPVKQRTVNPKPQNSSTGAIAAGTAATKYSTTTQASTNNDTSNSSSSNSSDSSSSSSYISDNEDSSSAPSYSSSASTETASTKSTTRSDDDNNKNLPETGEAMSRLLPLAGLMTIAAGLALLYFTRKVKKDDTPS